jgi:hypothetical protein
LNASDADAGAFARAGFSVVVGTAYGFFQMAESRCRRPGSRISRMAKWITQVSRNLTDTHDGFLRGVDHLILDRDPLYSAAFPDVLAPVE